VLVLTALEIQMFLVIMFLLLRFDRLSGRDKCLLTVVALRSGFEPQCFTRFQLCEMLHILISVEATTVWVDHFTLHTHTHWVFMFNEDMIFILYKTYIP